ncbi:uncharacterized protein RCO7_14343 [Rhynchosporium graminicola]|uniref:ZN622/Rei1/Reh1 zinc finger C2H2-type domain-containing protein n=1 Tax=Rhynchosporium graminicola TaxID=2792576 RepID=A0A1E1KAF3_9HELO|nr:uncharacterized protein RCO7_14343 [Rhynchosporium commune]
MASLPPVARSTYEEQLPKTHTSAKSKEGGFKSKSSPRHDGSSGSESSFEDDYDGFSPDDCLFCTTISDSTSSHLAHMSRTHNFVIPDLDHLLDIGSFLRYLSTITCTFHECLVCGIVEESMKALQVHMREEEHCRLELENDALELRDFWETDNGQEDNVSDGSEEGTGDALNEDGKIMCCNGELRLQSGKILGQRMKSRRPRTGTSIATESRSRSTSPAQQPIGAQNPNKNQASSPSYTEPSSSLLLPTQPLLKPRNEHKIVPRPGTSTSLIGLSDVQQRALRATEMRIEKAETKAKKIYEAKVDRKGNKQKTFRVLSVGKKAGGLEKRNG